MRRLQARHYARRTVKTYELWLRRFLRFHNLRHPREMGNPDWIVTSSWMGWCGPGTGAGCQ
ncbi:phage integrase N-terminal SAM-like domain-containing protein [Cyanobium sp. NIES-981]|uniref:phage integrase N-terminal SAM-like domain-containing protein n=1 Tax=Cyanobium sp. NIES-981 TaxID=1851505 RepID=UPI0007DD542D|nr:phage integrase N-terminal SAM-like domain-containing protein [Cyanobium sp. NIES-981]SBO44700.1 protein of unknown function [Cyanobium sp. NIES-981]